MSAHISCPWHRTLRTIPTVSQSSGSQTPLLVAFCRGQITGRLMLGGQCQCGEGLSWNGKRCVPLGCPPGSKGPYPNCQGNVDSDDDDDDPGPGDRCSGGRVSRNGDCVCPGKLKWNGKNCVPGVCPLGSWDAGPIAPSHRFAETDGCSGTGTAFAPVV